MLAVNIQRCDINQVMGNLRKGKGGRAETVPGVGSEDHGQLCGVAVRKVGRGKGTGPGLGQGSEGTLGHKNSSS